MRDITLFHETLNKARQPYRITMGRALMPDILPGDSAAATAVLRRRVLALSGPDHARGQPLLGHRPGFKPGWA